MSTDPRSLNYPSHDDRDASTDEGGSPIGGSSGGESENADRRTGTNDELKELDRTERRKK